VWLVASNCPSNMCVLFVCVCQYEGRKRHLVAHLQPRRSWGAVGADRALMSSTSTQTSAQQQSVCVCVCVCVHICYTTHDGASNSSLSWVSLRDDKDTAVVA